jgi:predicted DCC family thiol-disulfide oxidoreductase YuxK
VASTRILGAAARRLYAPGKERRYMAQTHASLRDPSGPVVLFDGVCNLCNAWVSFLIDRDRAAKLRFGSLQSDAARELLELAGRTPPKELEGVMLVEGARIYERSTAALRTIAHLGGFWRLFEFLLVIPVPLRDSVYLAIAASRYRLFGKRATCRVPTAGERERFIDASSL